MECTAGGVANHRRVFSPNALPQIERHVIPYTGYSLVDLTRVPSQNLTHPDLILLINSSSFFLTCPTDNRHENPQDTMAPGTLPVNQSPPSHPEVEAGIFKSVGPATLILEGTTIYQRNVNDGLDVLSTPLYELSRPIHPLPKQQISIQFRRAGPAASEKTQEYPPQPPEGQRQLFYLVHPQHADYRDDIQASYYLTSVASDMMGNIYLTTPTAMFQRKSLIAIVCKGRNTHDKPLFDDDNEEVLFTSKPGVIGDQWRWMDRGGQEIAREELSDNENKLVVTTSMDCVTRDALVALWVLKMWRDVAESPQAKRRSKVCQIH